MVCMNVFYANVIWNCVFPVDVSLLERLMTQNDLYKKDDMEFDKRYVSKLLLNYRYF